MSNRSARDRRRTAEGAPSTRKNSASDTPTSPIAAFTDTFQALLRFRSNSSSKPDSSDCTTSPPTQSSASDGEDYLPTVSELRSNSYCPPRRHSDTAQNIETPTQRIKHLGRQQLRKLSLGTSHKPRIENILAKDQTRKLTKFWVLSESNDSDAQSESFPFSEGANPDTDFPPTRPGSLFTGLSSIAEDPHLPAPRHMLLAMDTSRLAPGAFEAPERERRIKAAKDMYLSIVRNAERSGTTLPPYDFVELIGKGGFGLVYKCKEQRTGDLVAVKITNIDDDDFKESAVDRHKTLDSFRKEVGILHQLKDSNAKNINIIRDAFDLHNQLWIVADYCTGGSLRTLLRASPASRRGFEEHFIIPIARELAVAIKSVHDIGVVHRDIKCANVYVSEEGDIQLGDFGIVGEVEAGGSSKRRTIIGTPHYLPLEMHIESLEDSNITAEAYGTEVDIWAYGATLYEACTGQPPNMNVEQRRIRDALDYGAPRLKAGDYSEDLREFVAFCLQTEPTDRPSIDAVLQHPYIANSSKRYPTRILVGLIERYAAWEYKGGQRQSLWMEGGAAAPVVPGDDDLDDENEAEDWNFSISDNFNTAFGKRFSQMVPTHEYGVPQLDSPAGAGLPPLITKDLTPFQRIKQQHEDRSANRGERSLDRLFNPDTTPYELHTPVDQTSSDLPLRDMGGPALTRESMVDMDGTFSLDMNVPTFNFDFGDAPTLRARTSHHVVPEEVEPEEEEEDEYQYGADDKDEKRATMEWTFPSQSKKRATMDWTFGTAEPAEPEDPDMVMDLPAAGSNGVPPGFRPTLKHTTTEPVGHFRDFVHPRQALVPSSSSPVRDSVGSMIDLDMSLANPADITRPSTANSAAASVMTDVTSGNPFDLEDDPEQNEVDRNRFSYHKQWRSDGGQVKRLSHKTMAMHSRGNSLTSTDSELDRRAAHPRAPADDALDYDYSYKMANTMRTQMTLHIPPDRIDLSRWPTFDPNSGLDESPVYPSTYAPRLASPADIAHQPHSRQPNGPNGGSSGGGTRPRPSDPTRSQREIEFPEPVGPHPQALMEGAEAPVVAAELSRLLDDLARSFRATSRALRLHTGVRSTEGSGDETEDSGADSGAGRTGDDEEEY